MTFLTVSSAAICHNLVERNSQNVALNRRWLAKAGHSSSKNPFLKFKPIINSNSQIALLNSNREVRRYLHKRCTPFW